MLELRNIKKDYITASETVNALKGVDLTLKGATGKVKIAETCTLWPRCLFLIEPF